MKTITFYQSAICPRCLVAKLFFKQLMPEFPGIQVEPVEFLTNRSRARADGVSSIPALVCGDRRVSGFLLTKGGIRRFLESIR